MLVKKPVDEEMENEIDRLTEEFNEFKAQVSDARKKDIDTTYIDMRLAEFPALVMMVRAAYEQEEFAKLKKYVKDLKHDLEEAKEGYPVTKAIMLIREIYDDLRKGRAEAALTGYNTLMVYYKALNPELRRVVYSACIDIREKIIAGWTSDLELAKILARP